MRAFSIGETPKEVRAAVRKLLAANREDSEALMTAYRRESAWSIHGVAARLGKTAFEATLQLLGASDEILRSPGQNVKLDKTIVHAGMVLDDSSLATLVFVEAYALLSELSERIVLGPRMAAELRRFPSTSRLNREHSHVSLDDAGEIVLTTVSDEQRAAAKADAETLAVWAKANCEEQPAPWCGADIAPREVLEQLFGVSGLQALGVAKALQLPLITDDEALALLARTVDVRTASTADLLRWFGELRVLDGRGLLHKAIALAGAGYLPVSLDATLVVAAGNACAWIPTDPPLRDCFRLLFNRQIGPDARVPMAAAVILGAFQRGVLPERRRHVVATALWAVDVLGVGDQTLDALVNQTRAALPEADRPAFEELLKRRREIVESQARPGLILAKT